MCLSNSSFCTVPQVCKGVYICAGCGSELFSSDVKFDSGTGWPSFWDVISKSNVELKPDYSGGLHKS